MNARTGFRLHFAPITVREAYEAAKDWEPDNKPLDKGYDPYNSADTEWNRWLLCLAYGLL